MTDKNKKRLSVCVIAVFALVMVLSFVFVGIPMLRIAEKSEDMQLWADDFKAWVDGLGILGQLAFVLIMIVQTIVAFIPGEPLEIVAGYAFGAYYGTFLCLLGEFLGSVCVFAAVKKWGVKLVEVFFSREKINSLKFLKNEKRLEKFVFFVFLAPGTPKDLLCYFVGLTPMRISTWLIISSVARFPSVVTSAVGGKALGEKDLRLAVIVFAATVLASVAGYAIYTLILRKRGRSQ